MTASTTRRCSRCHEPKPLDAFRLDSRGYVRSHCRSCSLEATQEWRSRNHAQLLDRRRNARKVAAGREEAPADR